MLVVIHKEDKRDCMSFLPHTCLLTILYSPPPAGQCGARACICPAYWKLCWEKEACLKHS